MRLTTPLPLRTTAGWSSYTQTQALPVVYGRVTLSPLRYDSSGHLWLIADHPIGGIDRVEIDGQNSAAWALRNGTDHSGEAVAVLETQAQIANASDLAVTVRGALHRETGEALDRPDLVIWDLLQRVAGYQIDYSVLDGLRAWSQSQGVSIGGVIDNQSLSVQGAVDIVCEGCGLGWSSEAREFAFPWPPAPMTPLIYSLHERDAPGAASVCSGRAITTVVEVAYGYDWATQDHSGTVTLQAPQAVDRYGEVRERIEAGWLRTARAAIAYGERWLRWHARPIWDVSATRTRTDAQVGDDVAIVHRYSPITAGVLTGVTVGDFQESWSIQGPAGELPEIEQTGISSVVATDLLQLPVATVAPGVIEATFTHPDGSPLAGARVVLDGAIARTTNQAGVVRFEGAATGPHSLVATASGLEPQTLLVTVP